MTCSSSAIWMKSYNVLDASDQCVLCCCCCFLILKMKDSFSFLSYYSLISDNKPRKDMVFSNVYMVSNLVICLLCSCSDPPARHRAVCSWSPLLVSECKDGVSVWRCESLPAERVEQTPDGETHCVVLCFSSNQSAIHILLVVLNVVMKCCPNTCSSLLFWIFCLF